jgi:hypothetical protein
MVRRSTNSPLVFPSLKSRASVVNAMGCNFSHFDTPSFWGRVPFPPYLHDYIYIYLYITLVVCGSHPSLLGLCLCTTCLCHRGLLLIGSFAAFETSACCFVWSSGPFCCAQASLFALLVKFKRINCSE